MGTPLAGIVARGVTKTFPGVCALDGVDFELRPGEVHALIGENGAGKSTLISILAGAMRPSSGEFEIAGAPVALESPIVARRLGIATIFQELSIEPWLTVADNVVLGDEPGTGPGRFLLSPRRAYDVARSALSKVGADSLDLRAPADSLSTGQKQLVEIARALAVGARFLIMDEPTSSLPAQDAERLLKIVRQLRDDGTGILFVSHRLDEVREIADRVTVLREGRVVDSRPAEGMTITTMIELMTGHKVGGLYPERCTAIGDVVLRVDGLTSAGRFADVSFEVRAGEVLGFAGLIGAGRSEVMRALYGADPVDCGRIELDGCQITVRSPRHALAAGIAYLPEDRRTQGLVLNLPVRDNMVMSTLRRFTRHGVVSRSRIREVTGSMVKVLKIQGRMDTAVANLSGGNQQKVVLAKALISQARVLIFDEATRGVDVGAKYEVHALIQELAAQGAAVIVVSSELDEVMNVAHRIVVMSQGRVYGRYEWPDYDEAQILSDAFAAFTSRGKTVPHDG